MFAVAWSLALWCALAPADQPVVVQNPSVALRWRATPVPQLLGIVHRGSATELLAAPAGGRLFTINLGAPGQPAASFGSEQATQGALRVEPAAGGQRLTADYGGFPQAGLAVQVTVLVPATGPLTTWSISLRTTAPVALRSVVFPQVMAAPAIGRSEDDVLVVPSLPGVLIRNPAQAWPARYPCQVRYPGDMSLQFIAYQDATAGLYLSSQDRDGHPRRLGADKRPEGYAFEHEYTIEAGERATWAGRYPCVLGVTQGSWLDSADLYKAWAVQQPWCRRRLSERSDVPAWLKAGPLVHVCSMRTYGPGSVETGSYWPQVLDHVATLRQKVAGDIVLMTADWERDRRWSAGPYFPMPYEGQARPILQQLRRQGVRPFVFLSGLFWTFHNEGVNGNRPEVPEALKTAFVTDPATGQLGVYKLGESHGTVVWVRHSHQFCPSHPATTAWLCGVIDQAHERGIDVVQMDQTTGGTGAACGDPKHGHVVGPGRYQTTDFVRLLDTARRHGKQLTADFALMHEEPHEELIPYVDCFHVREYKERYWYRGKPGAVGIPLFDYVYHEYAMGYGGDSAGMSNRPDPFAVRVFAVNLLTGRTPGFSLWSTHERVKDGEAAQYAMLRQHTVLLQQGAAPFLMLGRMLHPLPLQVPEMTYHLPAKRGDKWVREPFAEPAVLTTSWQAPDGRVLHLLVNPTPQAVPVDVPLDTRQAATWATAKLSVYSSADGERFREQPAPVALPYRLQRTLAAGEVYAAILQPAR